MKRLIIMVLIVSFLSGCMDIYMAYQVMEQMNSPAKDEIEESSK